MTHHCLKWFLNRIGKRVYRLIDYPCCRVCDEVYKNGLVIYDRAHAQYLYDAQGELQVEYADKKLK